MHAEESGDDNHHDDYADNIENAHGSTPAETFANPRASRRRNQAIVKYEIRFASKLPPAIAVITTTTEQQQNDNDDK